MSKLLRTLAIAGSALLVIVTSLTVLGAGQAEAADSIQYTFRFVNGITLTGAANDKEHFLPDAGGSSVDNPTGMTVHLSCSDEFPGGWGEKDGPEQGIDTAWQIASYFIQKGSKTCGTPTPPPPPPDPPAIDIEKYVNGEDADDPTGPEVNLGDTVVFSYVVTNTGGSPLRDVVVVDSTLGPIPCPQETLEVGESMECDEQSEVATETGPMTMKATVTGVADVLTPGLPQPIPSDAKYAVRFSFVNGTTVTRISKKKDEFFPEVGGTSVENPTGVKIHLSCSDEFPGGWGEKDGPEQGVDTAWQIASFSIGKVKDGRFELKCGDPFAVPSEEEVMDMDPIHFIVVDPPDPKIDIEKFVNGEDADVPTGPRIPVGAEARFTYLVMNTGDVDLENVRVVDNVVGPLDCPRSRLDIGQSMECSPTTMTVEDGQQFMEACVEGTEVVRPGRVVTDCDPVWYFGDEKTGPSAVGDMASFDDGTPAAGVVVDLFAMAPDGSRGPWLGDTRTNSAGIYGFDDLGAGCYVVVFIAPNGTELIGGNTGGRYLQLATCLDPGEADLSLDAVLKAAK